MKGLIYFLVLVFLIIIIGSGGYYTSEYVKNYSAYSDQELRNLLLLEEIKSGFLDQFQEATNYLNEKNPENVQKYKEHKETVKKKLNALKDIAEKVSSGNLNFNTFLSFERPDFKSFLSSEEGTTIIKETEQRFVRLDNIFLEIIKLTSLNKWNEAFSLLSGDFRSEVNSINKILSDFIQQAKTNAVAERSKSQEKIQLAQRIFLASTILTSIFALIFGIVTSKKLTREITDEIKRVTDAVRSSLEDIEEFGSNKKRKK